MKKSENNIPKKGMNRQTHPAELSAQEYSFALNANIQEGHGDGDLILVNEPSNIKCSGFKDGFVVVKHKFDRVRNKTYFFLVNPTTGCSEIGWIDMTYVFEGNEPLEKTCNCEITVVLEDGLENIVQESTCKYNTLISDYCSLTDTCTGCLGFSLETPIRDVVIRHSQRGDELYFTDGIKPQRYLKIDEIDSYFEDVDDCTGEVTETCLDCDKLRIFNQYDFPCAKAETIQNGGSLRAGMYEVTLAYSDVNGNEFSDYLSIINPVAIFDFNNIVLDQTRLDYQTNQAFSVEISGLDSDYDYYRVVVISRTGNNPGNIYTTYGVFPTSQNRIVISSLPTIREEITERNEYDILNRRPLYLTAKGLSEVNGYLFQHTLTNQRIINLQPVVSLMGGFVKWGTVEAFEKLYKDGVNTSLYKGYMRDETYPLSIQFKGLGGFRTNNFVFIPRPPTDEEISVISGEDKNYQSITESLADCADEGRDKVWQFLNTATVDEEMCLNANSEGEVEVEETYSCQSKTEIEVGKGYFPYTFPESIAQYIDENRDEILASTDPALEDIQEALADFEEYEDCTPDVGENCDSPELTSESIVVLSVEGEQDEEVEIPLGSYTDVLPPESCSNLVDPITTDTAIENALPLGSTVYQKVTPSNISCVSAVEVLNLTAGVAGIGYYLDDKAEIGGNTTLLTTTTVSNTSDVFKNKLHSNAIFFKISAFPTDTTTIQLSNTLCATPDDNTNNSVRVSFFDGCPTLTEVPTYGGIIPDLATATVGQRTLTVDNADFPSGVIYVAVDSPMRSDFDVDVELTGTSGSVGLNIDGTAYVATFATDLSTTTSNFYTANEAGWISQGITPSLVGDVITLRMSEILFGTLTVNTISGDLGVTSSVEESYYTLQPPCGCIAVYKRPTETDTYRTYDSITFTKQQTYTYTCQYSEPIVTECDPAPFKKGKFSHWESTYKYPCNEELYDSSWLNIRTTDIPDSIKDDFEEYYVESISGANYVLNSETDFKDKPIRHYKFPNSRVIPFMRTQDGSQTSKPDSFIYPIGFIIDNEVVNAFLDVAVTNGLISTEERSLITGYEIFRGDRATERSVIAKGLAFNTRTYGDIINGRTTSYPNYPLNQLGGDNLNGLSSDLTLIPNAMFTFHSPDTHFNKPTLPFELGFEGYQLGYSENSFAPLKDHPKWVILGKRAKALATSLSILEATAETLILVSELLVIGSSGGLSAPLGVATAITAGTGIALSALFKIGRYRYEWLNTLEQLGNNYNFAYTALAIGKYHDFKINEQEDYTLRRLKISSYLTPGYKELREEGLGGQSVFINNFQRESSTLIKTSNNFPLSYESWVNGYDNSRLNIPGSATGTINGESRTVAPYVTLKQFLPTQYNTLNSIQWLPTGYCGNLSEDTNCDIIFGGDIFISRMTLKRKFPFFTETAWKLSADTPFKYSSYFNINTTIDINRGFVDFKTSEDTFSAGSTIFPSIPTRYSLWDGFNWRTDKSAFYLNDEFKFLTYYYGIPNFLVESEINLNYRYARLEKHEDFYPNVGDALTWTQQSEVAITNDNEYNYNFTYSGRPHKWAVGMLPVNYNREEWDKLDDKSNGIIYSQQDDISSSNRSPHLNYKTNDFHNFNKSFGDLIDVRSIESEQLLVRFSDGMLILGAVDNLRDRLTESNKRLGSGGIFEERFINFNKTELGSAGTQHKIAVSTEFGHYWCDAKRGKVYELAPNGKGLAEISQTMDKWFKEQLPFKILKTYPNVDIDNAYGGIGISMGWDDRLKRLFVTKLDYIPKVKDLNYSNEIGFYQGEPTCPEGYDLIDGACTLVETAEKIQTGTVLPTIDAGTFEHGMQAPALYSSYTSQGAGYVDGGSPTGFTFERLTDPFWVGNEVVANRITTILAKWVTPSVNDAWVGGTSIVKVPSTKIYYVLLCADNLFRFSVDGVVIMTSDTTAIGVQHTAVPGNYTAQTFRQVHIYPIELSEGCHTVTIEGYNIGDTSAMFASAILDNTAQELRDATSMDDLNFLYSTEDAESLYTGEITFTCPEGFEEKGEDICDECERTSTETLEYDVIELADEDYFEKAYWTVGYSPLTKTWISYYSFYPNYYNNYNDYFQTGINSLGSNTHGLWTHHPLISSYQVFYGKLFPYIVEIASKTNGLNSHLDSVQFYLDVRKYYNTYDFSDTFGKGFNKSYIYNNFQNSGLLELNFQEGNNQRQMITFPKYNSNSISVLQSETEGRWSFNFLYNSVKNERQGLPIWINDNVQVLKDINPTTIDYRAIRRDRLRGDYFLTRLIQDSDSRNKMFFRMTDITRDYYE